jgi:hypothetical protein
MVNMARALGTSLGVAITALGVNVASQHHWAGPEVVLGVLSLCSVALAATTLARPTTSSQTMTGCAR